MIPCVRMWKSAKTQKERISGFDPKVPKSWRSEGAFSARFLVRTF